jgi:hypothetical protein
MNVFQALEWMMSNPYRRIRSNITKDQYFYNSKECQIEDDSMQGFDINIPALIKRSKGEEYEIVKELNTLKDLFGFWLENRKIQREYKGTIYTLARNDIRVIYSDVLQAPMLQITPEMAAEKVWWVEE